MKRGFTLVELLIVVAIIGILASVTLMALSQAQGQAKIYRTQTTIAKIDSALTEVYERFEFRAPTDWEVPSPPCDGSNNNCLNNSTKRSLKRTTEARARYLILREEMRLEMPQMGLALTATSESFIPNIARACECPVHPPTPLPPDDYNLSDAYHKSFKDAFSAAEEAVETYRDTITAAGVAPADATSSELLYLIIETNNPEAIANFKGGEIGDTDGNGLFEFVDAWGRPIRFLRFAPGLQDSQRQPAIPDNTLTAWRDALVTGAPYPPAIRAAMLEISAAHPDPLYPRQADDTDQIFQLQWLTFPMIYSLGADGVAGIVETPFGSPPPRDVNALVPISPTNIRLGAPLEVSDSNYATDSGCDRDNVTNHNMTRPF